MVDVSELVSARKTCLIRSSAFCASAMEFRDTASRKTALDSNARILANHVRRNWRGTLRRVKKEREEKMIPASRLCPVAAYVTIETTDDNTGSENAIALFRERTMSRVRR